MNFIDIESASDDVKDKVKQTLRFKTGKFVWRVKFTAPLDPATVNSRNLYVTDQNQDILKTAIRYNSDTHEIEIEPLEAYVKDSSYTLNISKNVRSVGGQALKGDLQVQFKV
ncbi:MAG: Ig-like domain-containing protein [Lachnospiraceae bacterium]|nr:Ig-like domain-containing protein [Lachnospiraceae bacterium]